MGKKKGVLCHLTSLPNQNLENISLEEALMLFKLPRKVGDFNGNEITANNGRFGPYLQYERLLETITDEKILRQVSKEVSEVCALHSNNF